MKKITAFFISLLLILNSALSHAFAIRQWTVSNPMAVGASMLYDGSKGTVTSSVLITPNASQVAKVLRGGLAGYALSFAVEQLLGAVDWVLDPENNQIRYTKEPDPTDPNDPTRKYLWKVGGGSPAAPQLTPELACKAYTGISCDSVVVNSTGSAWGCWTYKDQKQSCAWIADKIANLIFDPNVKPEEKTLPLETIAQKVIENAESDNLDAQFAVLAAANNILSEAENDDAKAKPIEDELENSAKCPSGIVRNGGCWICDKSQFMPITRATRDTLFRNLINARIQENACWLPPDPNHATALLDAQNALSLCEN